MKIGISHIEYSEDGLVKSAKFTPTMEVHLDSELIKELKKLADNTKEEIAKKNADSVFASWFNEVSRIELANRNEYRISSNIHSCQKYASGNVKSCDIVYYFIKINEAN